MGHLARRLRRLLTPIRLIISGPDSTPQNLGVETSKALVLPPKTLGRTLNYTVEAGAMGLRKRLNVTHFVDLEYQGFGGGVPIPTADCNDVNVPDHIVFMVKSSDVREIQQAANWIISRRKDLEKHSQASKNWTLKQKSTNPFDSDEEGNSGISTERYKVFFVPHITVVGEKILSDSGILNYSDVGELHLDLVPLDDDFLSCEVENLLLENSVDGVTSGCHFTVARCIMKLQNHYGIIPNVKGIGKAAQSVIEKIFSERIDDEGCQGKDKPRYNLSNGEGIDTLVVIDREVDFVTPLLTPLTYEGLIDEVVGIQNGYIKVDPTLVEVEEDEDTKKSPGGESPSNLPIPQMKIAIPLNSSDSLFEVVRNQNIEKLGSFLQDKAKSIRESYASFRQNKDASITEIHQFVKQIPGLTQNYKSLNQHINLAELVKKATDNSSFRERWQTERAILEGEFAGLLP